MPVVATGNVHYAEASGSRLRDALLAIDQNMSLTVARRGCCRATAARRFAGLPEALSNSLAIVERCHASLDFSARPPAFNVADGVRYLRTIIQPPTTENVYKLMCCSIAS